MAIDPVQRLAIEQAMKLSADVEVQLTTSRSEPLLVILHNARQQAAQAIVNLVDVDPEDHKAIRALQNEVVRFHEMIEWLQQIYAKGFDAEQQLTAAQQQEIEGLVLSDQEKQRLGLATEGDRNDD